jgi:hypothetical protein
MKEAGETLHQPLLQSNPIVGVMPIEGEGFFSRDQDASVMEMISTAF